MAFPQCLLSTSDVIVAIAEGRYKPAAKPTPNRPQRISHKLVAKAVNPRDNRETLVSLTRTGLAAHDAIVTGALERNQRLLEQLNPEELALLLGHIDRLTDTAAEMLAAEKDLS